MTETSTGCLLAGSALGRRGEIGSIDYFSDQWLKLFPPPVDCPFPGRSYFPTIRLPNTHNLLCVFDCSCKYFSNTDQIHAILRFSIQLQIQNNSVFKYKYKYLFEPNLSKVIMSVPCVGITAFQTVRSFIVLSNSVALISYRVDRL